MAAYLTDDNGTAHVLLLNGLTRFCSLDGDDDGVAKACVAALGASKHFEDTADLCAGVVCNCND